jgi:hypothetical protein
MRADSAGACIATAPERLTSSQSSWQSATWLSLPHYQGLLLFVRRGH